MEFESAAPNAVRSIKQRDLLNTWLRLYDKRRAIPAFDDYQPERLTEELPDLVYCSIQYGKSSPRIVIDSDGTRMSNAFGTRGGGRYLDEYLGPKLSPTIVPIYWESIARQLPMYTVSQVDDLYGRKVDYERLLMPFATDGRVDRIIASFKTISEDGGFEIRNLMRANDDIPLYLKRCVIDRELHHRLPGRIVPGEVIEFI